MDAKCINVRAPAAGCRTVPEVLMKAFRNPDGTRVSQTRPKRGYKSHALRREDSSMITDEYSNLHFITARKRSLEQGNIFKGMEGVADTPSP